MKRWMSAWAALAVMVAVAGCSPENDTITPGDVAEGEVTTTAAITVQGEVESLLDQRSFTMSGDAEFFSDNMVVVSRFDLPALTVGDEIEVTGTVRNVGRVEIEEETNWQFNPQVTIELEEVTGYLVADAVRVVERD